MIRIHDLTRSFGPELVVDRVGTTVSTVEIYALIGPNGVGRSTLVTPTSGAAAVNGFDVVPDSRRVRAALLGCGEG